MAGSGPSELILLSAGLIVAAIVSGVLLQTWNDMDDILDERGKQGAEDVRTRASLVSDPRYIQWDTATDSANIYLQNSGESFLDVNAIGVLLEGSNMAVTLPNSETQWLPGQNLNLNIDGTASGLSYASGTHDVLLTFSVSSTASGYTGSYTVTEEVRIVVP